MTDRELNTVKKAARRAVIVSFVLALICHSVPDQYRAACDMIATICRGGL